MTQAAAQRAAAARQLAADAPLFVLLNAGSGGRDTEQTRTLIGDVLHGAGRRHRIDVLSRGQPVAESAQHTVRQAVAAGGAAVAAGGDGTLSAVAQAAHAAGCAMGVLPQGTFNYFSRTHGIPSDTAEAARALLTARVRPVQVGQVNERLFLVNASLGLYPQLLEDREQFKARFGRNRLVAMAAALATVLRQHRQLRLSIDMGGRPGGALRQVRTPTLFVGNNRLQFEQVGIAEAPALEHGRIAAVMLRPVGTWALLRLMLSGAMGSLGDAERVDSFQFSRITVQPAGSRRVKVAADGEVTWLRSPLEFRVAERPLYLLAPANPVARA